MKPAREPASSRPKPCAYLEKPHDSLARSPHLVGPRRKKTDHGQRSTFPSETSRFAPLIVTHRGSALPWLIDNSSCPPPSPNLVRIHPKERYQTLCDMHNAPCLSRVATSRRASNWSSEEARTWKHHPQPTIQPPRLSRPAESRRQPVGCIFRG